MTCAIGRRCQHNNSNRGPEDAAGADRVPGELLIGGDGCQGYLNRPS